MKGDVLDLEAGKMTLVDNLHYISGKTDVIFPDHIYRVGMEIPEGYYLFKFDKAYYKGSISYCRNEDECVFKIMLIQDTIVKQRDMDVFW